MKSSNIVFTGKNELELREEEVSRPQEGQALVETLKTLISAGTECICLLRLFEPGTHWAGWVTYPFYPGYSNVGRVVETGPGVVDFKPGDRIVSRSAHGQRVLADLKHAVKIPDDINDEDATFFALAKITQIGARAAELDMGDFVVLVGMGLLGQLVAQYVNLSGAREIVAVDTVKSRLNTALAHGGTKTLQAGVEDVREAVSDMTGGRMADVVFDITGNPATLPQCLPLIRKFGKMILLGDTGKPSEQRLTAEVVTKGITIKGAHDGNAPAEVTTHTYWTQENMVRLFFNYLRREKMKVSDLITHRFSPSEARAAYDLLIEKREDAMGVVFDWEDMG